jgi:hypothetical protein
MTSVARPGRAVETYSEEDDLRIEPSAPRVAEVEFVTAVESTRRRR